MVQPLQTGRKVIPTYVHHLIDSSTVVSCEETQEQLIILVDGPIGLGVNIVEVQGVSLKIGRELQEHIHIRATGCDKERGLIFYNRTFEGSLCSKESDAGATMQFALIARLTYDIKYSRGSPTILCRKQTLVERGRHQRIAVESRK